MRTGEAELTRWTAMLAVLIVILSIGLPIIGLRVFLGSDILLRFDPWASDAPGDHQVVNPLLGDTVDQYLPLRSEFRERVHDGEYPMWSSRQGSGAPLGSTPDAGYVSPLNLPYLVLPLWYAPAVSKILEMAAAIGFTFLFLRRIGLGRPAAVVGGLVFVNSGFQVVWTNWPHTHVGALIPALFWSVEALVSTRDPRRMIPVALVVAVMLLEGFPAVAGFAIVAVMAYALVRAAVGAGGRIHRPGPSGRIVLAGGAVAAGFGLAAFQILPFERWLDVLDLSHRVQTPSSHLPWESLVTLGVPNAFGSHMHGNYGSFAIGRNYVEIQSFIGVTALVLAVVGIARKANLKPGALGYLRGASVGSLLLIYVGGPPLWLVQTLLPPLYGMNSVGRMRSLFGFLLATLAAVGFDAIVSRRDRVGHARLVWLAAAGGAGLLGWRLVANAVDAGEVDYVLRWSILPLACGVVAVAVIVIGARSSGRGLPVALTILPVLVVVEAVAFVTPYWPRVSREHFFPVTSTHRFLLDRVGNDRIVTQQATLYPGTTTYYGLRSVTTHSMLNPTWRDLLRAVDPDVFRQSPTFPFIFDHSEDTANSPVLDRLAARYYVAGPHREVLGDELPPQPAAGAVRLEAEQSTFAIAPEQPLRAVTVALLEHARVEDPSYIVAEVLREDVLLGRGRRRIFHGQPPGPYAVAVSQGPEQLYGPDVRVRISLEGGGELMLATTPEDMVSTGYVVARDDGLRLAFSDGTVIYERTTALPRIRWAARALVVEDERARIQALQEGVDPRAVILSAAGPEGSGADADLRVHQDGDDAIRVSVEAGGDGYLVVADGIQPFWEVFVDGRGADLLEADHAGAGVFVPEGSSEVVFRYRLDRWWRGVALSAFTAALLVLLAWPPRGFRRRFPGLG